MNYIKRAYSQSKSVITGRILPFAKKHKVISAIALVALVFGGYQLAQAMFGGSGETRYALARVARGELKNTIIGTGQVSASNQIELKAKASADIIRINAKAGLELKAGDVIAQLDTKNIAISLETARLSLQKTTKPADATDINQAQYAIDDAVQAKAEAEVNLAKAYQDALTAVSSSFIDLPAIISGMSNMLYSRDGFLNDASPALMAASAQSYRNTAGVQFDLASNDYKSVQSAYKESARSNATATTDSLLTEAHSMASTLSESLKNAAIAADYIKARVTGQSATNASAALNEINGWISKNNSNLNALISAKTSIENAKNTVTTAGRNINQKKEALIDLQEGADPLDVRSQQLSVRQRELEYGDYFVRAPFDGVLASLTAKVGDSASNGIGTFITKQKIAEVTLNEIDAANVVVGQPVELSFDAVEDVTATGTVASIDLVGTVSQGVVSYTTQIAFDTEDERIKPGMSVTATITTKSKADVLLVPVAAVKTRGNQKYVEIAQMGNEDRRARFEGGASGEAMGTGAAAGMMVMNANGIALENPPVERMVTIGDSSDTYTEITSGLEVGEFVVTRTIADSGNSTTATAQSSGGLFGSGARAGGGNAVRATGGAMPAGGGSFRTNR
ncbi:MAG TPA: HlyD family efflux transporter periplasmic adaptor subunit [Candidatus Paceibacterota bacterium]